MLNDQTWRVVTQAEESREMGDRPYSDWGAVSGNWSQVPMHDLGVDEDQSALPSRPSPVIGAALLVLVISTCWGSFLEETGTGFATMMGHASQIMVILFGLMVLANTSFSGAPVVFTAEFFLFSLFAAWVLLGVPFSDSPELSRLGVVTLIKLLIMAIIILNTVNGRQIYVWLLVGLTVTMLLASLGALSGFARGAEILEEERGRGARYSGSFGNANGMGRMTCLGVWATFSLFLVARSKFLKLLLIALIIWGVVVIVLTGSKQSLIALFLAALAGYWFVLRRSSRGIGGKIGWLVVIALGLGVTVVALSGTFISERMESFTRVFTQGSGSRSDTTRLTLLLRGLHRFAENPVTGAGYRCGGFGFGRGGYMNLHNTITAVAAETGLPGWLFFFGAWFILLKRLRRVSRLPLPLADFKLAASVWLLPIMFGLWTFTSELTQIKHFWMCIAGAIGYLAWVERTWKAHYLGEVAD